MTSGVWTEMLTHQSSNSCHLTLRPHPEVTRGAMSRYNQSCFMLHWAAAVKTGKFLLFKQKIKVKVFSPANVGIDVVSTRLSKWHDVCRVNSTCRVDVDSVPNTSRYSSSSYAISNNEYFCYYFSTPLIRKRILLQQLRHYLKFHIIIIFTPGYLLPRTTTS